ncbi:HEAT repeat domain-containing protein [Actinophytocola sediminis]
MVPVNTTQTDTPDTRLVAALGAQRSSTRLAAVMAAGTHPDPALADVLVARCAVEPDFYVRDMLTWALTRLPAELTVPKLVVELQAERPQARSQALHTLSKIGDGSAWPAITRSLLHHADEEVARSAWRAAVVLVPDDSRRELAEDLAVQLGRGDRNLRLSLSQALVALGEVSAAALRPALASKDPAVRAHATATEALRRDPDAAFDPAVDEATRVVVLGRDGGQ